MAPPSARAKTAAQRVAAQVKAAREAQARAEAETKTGTSAPKAPAGSPQTARGTQKPAGTTARTAGSTRKPQRHWTVTIGPSTIALTLVAFIAIGIWAAVATGMLLFGDRLSARLVAQQSDMQYAYEQKLVVFRAQLDRFARQTRLERDGVEGRIADLMLRQAALEARQAMLTALADQTRPPEGLKPAQFGSDASTPARTRAAAAPFRILDPSHPAPERVAYLEHAMSRVEGAQLQSLGRLTQRSQGTLLQLRQAFTEVGLDPDRFVPGTAIARGQVANIMPGVTDLGGGPFESNVALIRRTLSVLGRLRTAANAVPFVRPIPASLGQMTSSYGTRSDPFTGEARFHAGMDFRSPIGVPVRAGGSGVVQSAGEAGGYGNLVIVDHGNGVTTRYAHLSAFSVTTGQPVSAGMVVGLVGSTGRSTGPHLHYETRLQGDPQDPARFIRAGERLYE